MISRRRFLKTAAATAAASVVLTAGGASSACGDSRVHSWIYIYGNGVLLESIPLTVDQIGSEMRVVLPYHQQFHAEIVPD